MSTPIEAHVAHLTAERDQLRAAIALGQQNCDDAYDDLRAERDAARARAERAEAELKVSRDIVSKIWVQLGSPTYEQLKGRSIYDLIDEIKTDRAEVQQATQPSTRSVT